MMKKVLLYVLVAFVLAGAVNALLSSALMMELLKKKIERPNPMSHEYDRSPGEVELAIRNEMKYFGNMYLDVPGDKFFNRDWDMSVLPEKTFVFKGDVKGSYVYRTNGRGRFYDFSMYLYLDSLGPRRTRVRVETKEGYIISGYRPGIAHMTFIVPIFRKVEPSTVEEYQVLRALGYLLNVVGMPPVNYPRGLTRQELLSAFYSRSNPSGYDPELVKTLFPE